MIFDLCKALTCVLVLWFLPAVTLLPPQPAGAAPADHKPPGQGRAGQQACQADALQVRHSDRKYRVVFRCLNFQPTLVLLHQRHQSPCFRPQTPAHTGFSMYLSSPEIYIGSLIVHSRFLTELGCSSKTSVIDW